jgi:uridine kinase
VVAIDGRGGAGKSTLAGAISKQVTGVTVVPIDDFYRPMSEAIEKSLTPQQVVEWAFDWQRLREQVLMLVHKGLAARYQRYDWSTRRLGDWRTVDLSAVLIIEGVYSSRPGLERFYDLKVFVDVPIETSMRRLRDRGARQLIDLWTAADTLYLETATPLEAADLTVRGF